MRVRVPKPFLDPAPGRPERTHLYYRRMSQVTIYLPDDVERQLRAAARKAGKSFSSYIAELAMRKRTRKAWPRAFLATFGAWKGEFPEPPELPVEDRDEL